MNTQSDAELQSVYKCFEEGAPLQAQKILSRILPRNLENTQIIFALKCADFWATHINDIEKIPTVYEKGEAFLSAWEQFLQYIKSDILLHDKTVYAIKKGVFLLTRKNYQNVQTETDPQLLAMALARIGLCEKVLGNYEQAISYLQDANALKQNDASVLAEMADCYALCGEEKKAKVLFREAFFLNPQQIETGFLESELYCGIEKQTERQGYSGKILKEWLPIYGVLYGVFNVRRELRALEAGKLKQAVFALENELKNNSEKEAFLKPKLINHYFWLIDHLITIKGERTKIKETLLKIKLLDTTIHKRYTS